MHLDIRYSSIVSDSIMNSIVASLLLGVLLCATFAQVSQSHPHENQGLRSRRQASQDPNEDDGVVPDGRAANWTSCDITGPKLSCQDCTTRLICTDVGGLLIMCRNPYKPYCNMGICSPIPSAECA